MKFKYKLAIVVGLGVGVPPLFWRGIEGIDGLTSALCAALVMAIFLGEKQ